jgi:TPR repeat protein
MTSPLWLAQAQCNLALCYAGGTGVPRSRADARAWYERAAKQGHVQAHNNLAAMAAEGL